MSNKKNANNSNTSNNNGNLISLDQVIQKSKLQAQYDYKSYIKGVIEENYFIPCINKCFTDYESPLVGTEKACLAKCMDRVNDYYVIAQSELNPYNAYNQKTYLFNIDGIPVKPL